MDDYANSVIVGSLPPPLAGVTNHIFRLSKKYQIPVFQINKPFPFKDKLKFLFLKKKEIYIHTHIYTILLLVLVKQIFFKGKCEYYIVNHNFPALTEPNKNGIKNRAKHYIRKSCLKKCDKVYAVQKDIIPKMTHNFGQLQIELYDPFIPPDENNEQKAFDVYRSSVEPFFKKFSPVIISGAWQLNMHNGEDLYGFDLLISLISRLQKRKHNVGLIFFLGNPDHNRDYFNSIKRMIKELNLSENILLITGQNELWPAIKRSDLFIRATNTDGDPLSIKEALFFGTKVLASDCVNRAEGVKLFYSRDMESLEKETINILKEYFK